MISINDLLIFIIVFLGSCLLFAISVTLIIALVNLVKMTKKMNRLIDENSEHIGKTIKLLPGLADSFTKAGTSVKINADKIGSSCGAIEVMLTGSPSTGDESNTLQTIINIAESILKVIVGYFSKKEKE